MTAMYDRRVVTALGLLLLLAALPLRAQDSVIVIDPDAPPVDTLLLGGPPPEIVAELIAFYNDSGTTRTQGDVAFPPGSSFEGRLAAHRGTLRIAGRVRGPVAVVNGTLHLQPGARVEGDILVVGGRLLRDPDAAHTGTERVYWDAAPVVRTPDGLLVLRERRRPLRDLAAARTTFQTGRVRTTLLLATGGTYNRIEGLPIVFGPTFELRPTPRSALKLDLRGILRTAGDGSRLSSDFGYQTRLEYRSGRFGIAGRLYSEVSPIEDHPLSGSEVGWSALLLQRDYRDYFERRGGGGAVWVQPTRPLRLELSVRRDHERSVRAIDPWSIFRNSDQWRRNPLVDDGHFVTTGLQLDYDTRNERDFPSTGWLLRARYEHSTSDDVAPVLLPETVRPALPLEDYGFDRLVLDLRRYSRLTPGLRVNTRLRAEGWVRGDRLPVQRRTSLGGPDLLPGYDFRTITCAPAGLVDRALPALCDRVISAQVEVRTRVGLNLGYRLRDRDGGRTGRFIGVEEADLVFLTDAGKGWRAGDGPEQVAVDRIPSFREWKVDFGVGLDAGGIGAYLAKGISEGGPVKFLVRLQRRF
ncbi:MAG TPA: BamA/TamA family outer membrane protein [Gemmatimonadales bacterium]|nr:BamA/TamA family outer membrane protein [Gemmatimonadales bacterium]